MKGNGINMKKNQGLPIMIWSILSTGMMFFCISFIIIYIFIKGAGVVDTAFIADRPRGFPLGSAGGIFPAIVGSLMFTGIACVVASLLAISTSIYIVFYCRSSLIENIVRGVIESTAGIPSIVLGLFGYTFLVLHMGFGISLLSGGIVLGIMIFPFIEVRVEKSLAETSREIIYSSYALGVSKSYTIIKLVMREAIYDIASAIALSGGFAMGATAPIMLTGGVVYSGVPKSIFSPSMALPYHLYILIGESISLEYAYGTALVLVGILLLINFTALLAGLLKRGE